MNVSTTAYVYLKGSCVDLHVALAVYEAATAAARAAVLVSYALAVISVLTLAKTVSLIVLAAGSTDKSSPGYLATALKIPYLVASASVHPVILVGSANPLVDLVIDA